MGTLSFDVKNAGIGWAGNCTINYDAVYDQDTNRTTVTFRESSFAYFGRNGYGTTAKAAITVQAADNAAGSAASELSISGTTNGGSKTFTDTPTPATVTVQHSDSDGAKAVSISVSASVTAYMTSTAASPATGTGSGSATEQVGERASSAARIVINGAAVKATPYVGKNKAAAYRGRVKM